MGAGRGELPALGARVAPGQPPGQAVPSPPARPLPTGTYQVALVPRRLVVAVAALGAEGAAVAWAADAQAGATARAVAVASPVAAAGLLGPTGAGCTGRDQLAGSPGRGLCARVPPHSTGGTAGTPAAPSSSRSYSRRQSGPYVPGGQQSARVSTHSHWKKSGCCCRLGRGRHGSQPSATCPVPPCPCPWTHSWNHHCSTCSSLRSSSWWQEKSEGVQTPSSTSSRRVSLWGRRRQHGDVSPQGSWTPPDPPAGKHPPVLVLGQLLLLPGCVAPTEALVLRPLQALGMWWG